MKVFYLAFPTQKEDEIIEKVGAFGAVHLSKEYTIKGFSKIDNIETCEKYEKLRQRINTILSTLVEEKPKRISFVEKLRSGFKRDSPPPIAAARASLEDVEKHVSEVERELDARLSVLDRIQTEINNLRSLVNKATLFKKYGMRIDDVGDFEYLFVKAGFLNNEFLPKLRRYVEGTSIKYLDRPGRKRESFVAITGLNEDKSRIEEALTLLNFGEITFPKGLNSDPKEVVAQTEKVISEKQEEIEKIKGELEVISDEFMKKGPSFEPLIRRTLKIEEARSCLSRTQTLSLMHGWIPEKKMRQFKDAVEDATKGTIFMKFEDPTPDDNPPVQLENKGVFSYFDLLTRLRGMPNYFEIDPTPVTTILFTTMFGFMFGDIGQGFVFVVLGYMFIRLRKGFLGIPAGAIKKLGGIMLVCGVSSMFFGALYGTIFLHEAFHPLFINPLHELTGIIIVALMFGVIQLSLGLILNIANELQRKNMIGAVLGGHGLIALMYYIGGVMLAVRFSSRMSLDTFLENLPLTIIALGALILIFLSPLLEGFLEGERKIIDKLMMGFGHGLETFIAFLTNSISYIRLAAFALAHAALGLSATILGNLIGILPSFLLLNILVILIEGMATIIQSMRLTYYEFYTKFYSGGGLSYRPFVLERA